MDPEELELMNDYRYRNYASVIEKALRNFESSTEWADLISSLGKLNKVWFIEEKYNSAAVYVCRHVGRGVSTRASQQVGPGFRFPSRFVISVGLSLLKKKVK